MGALVDGVWSNEGLPTVGAAGQFVRPPSSFRDWITNDTGGHSKFPAEEGRYHLFVSYACPWAHRTLLYRTLLNLETSITVSIVHPINIVEGWMFSEFPGATIDHVNSSRYLHEIYTLADRCYTGRVSVPVLWDKVTRTIVNNESAEIIKMIGDCSEALGGSPNPYRPPGRETEIDKLNETIYVVNNGVYRCGFAKSQDAYSRAVAALFGALDELEETLGDNSYLLGGDVTECDWRLFTTAVRFDAVYFIHFKCSLRRYSDYPRLQAHLMRMLAIPGVMETVQMDHIRHHYYQSHLHINPNGIIPAGPTMSWERAVA
jgi:putative glutathione S-transferase